MLHVKMLSKIAFPHLSKHVLQMGLNTFVKYVMMQWTFCVLFAPKNSKKCFSMLLRMKLWWYLPCSVFTCKKIEEMQSMHHNWYICKQYHANLLAKNNQHSGPGHKFCNPCMTNLNMSAHAVTAGCFGNVSVYSVRQSLTSQKILWRKHFLMIVNIQCMCLCWKD